MRNTGLKVGSIRPLCRAGGPPCPAVARCRQTAGSPIGVLAWRDDISMCQNVKQTHTGYGMGGSSTANFGFIQNLPLGYEGVRNPERRALSCRRPGERISRSVLLSLSITEPHCSIFRLRPWRYTSVNRSPPHGDQQVHDGPRAS
ncbi:unnamed protein product [Boreogadus saida]